MKYKNKTETRATKLRIAYPCYRPAAFYDPANIRSANEYEIIENIYSPLVEYNEKGEIVSAIAERFEWAGNEARFKIREDLKTIDGYDINAEDALLSLKRLFILSSNTHGNLKDMLSCGNIKKLTDNCANLTMSKDKRELIMKFDKRKIFLFPMLTAIDFAIIPKKSIDFSTLKIIDYRNTSGPYYIKRDDENGKLILGANPHHFHYSPKMPQNIYLIPSGRESEKESLKLFSENKVDHLTTIDVAQAPLMLDFARKRKDVNVHKTYPIHLYSMIFTNKGMKKTTETERIQIAGIVRDIFEAKYCATGVIEPSEQIFPVFGEASLDQERLNKIRKKIQSVKKVSVITKELLIWDSSTLFLVFPNIVKTLHQKFPNGKIIEVRKMPGLVNYKKEKLEEPDIYFLRGDTGFQEDISMLSYYSKADFFYLKGSKMRQWLNKYVLLNDKNERMRLLKDLHYETISRFAVVPLGIAPYVAIARKPWKMKFPKYFANNPIWMIQKD